jgi:hypothetical protein
MRSVARIVCKWFGAEFPPTKPPMMEALEARQFLSAVLPIGISVPPVIGPVPVVPPIKSVGETIHAATGQKFIGLVGEVENIGKTAVGAKEISDLGGLQALINWGDGTPDTLGALSLNSQGTVLITGTHRFGASGEDAVTVVLETKPPVLDPPTALAAPLVIATVNSTAEVTGGLTLTEIPGKSFTSVVGYFRLTLSPISTASSATAAITAGPWTLQASIDWGDGSTGTGTIKEVSPGFYSITGTHTYATKGKYTVPIGVTATPTPVDGREDPIILLLTSFDSMIDVK